MTTFRYEPLGTNKVTWHFVWSRLPSLISIYIDWNSKTILEMEMNTAGQIEVEFKQMEQPSRFELRLLRDLLGQTETELNEWNDRLREPGGDWENLN
jgi:hypothetical protein